MTNGGKRGGGDRVVESRHLVGLFLGFVVLCGVFFTLGYVMGRTQYGPAVRAAADLKPGSVSPQPHPAPIQPPDRSGTIGAKSSPVTPLAPKEGAPAPPAKKESTTSQPSTLPAARKPAPPPPAVSGKTLSHFGPPLIPRGAIVLQVAALTSERDALALADALQQKQFPAFVVTPGADKFYRVQVGPFADAQSAATAKKSLEREGFKAIVKR